MIFSASVIENLTSYVCAKHGCDSSQVRVVVVDSTFEFRFSDESSSYTYVLFMDKIPYVKRVVSETFKLSDIV